MRRRQEYRPILHPLLMFLWALMGGLTASFVVCAPLFYFHFNIGGCIIWPLVYLAAALFISVLLDKSHTTNPPKSFTVGYCFVVGITTGAALSLPFLWHVEDTWGPAWGCGLWVLGGVIGFVWAMLVADPSMFPDPPPPQA